MAQETQYFAILDASRAGDVEQVSRLLSFGVSPDTADVLSGYTALHNAIWSGSLEVVELLLDAGADIEHAKNTVYQTPLATAVLAGDAAMVRLLVERGADVSVTLYGGQSLIDGARSEGYPDVADILEAQNL